MKFRIPATLAACFLAAGIGLSATAQAQGAKSVSTQAVGQAAKGEKSVSTTELDPQSAAVKERFQQRFSGMNVTTVRRTPYGLFEVQLGMDLIYTDEGVTWVMEGPLIDAATRRDVTRESQEKLSAVTFDQLPLDLAIKQVKGDGSRKVAIFEDPNCGYCKQLRKTLEDVDNLTVYTFLYPILSPDSKVKVRNVWCAKDQGKTWDDWMLRGKTPAAANCDVPEDKLLALGQQLMVRGTPTLFFADGSRISGALPLDQLKARLN
ncbi:putative thiol:disulfide interchange protein DsbC [Achromobacter mucicolens]|uniref:DsbC family protein n=1 Tax=Achromobacter mucicolens TaxID=1389922 RepID=UPI000B9234A9|nr:DsbC family protein [Achromobacter mucicolens]OXC92530.1 disulfide bond formation protein DsbC [Achromobacter sp. KAs 3-5]WBX88769.1 DsbC family protein [Achromobacter mucicolens]CAB3667489.1 putative thiol:disulfide interchange protein DsbC [Achromobacter mucicolens]